MRTIRLGILPKPGSYRGTCPSCEARLEAEKHELVFEYDAHEPPDGYVRTRICTTEICDHVVRFYPTGVII